MEERVFIAGAGPVGMVAAAELLRRGVPVTVFEGESALATESRASTFHPPTLDMLDELGAAGELIAEGLIAPRFQYRRTGGEVIADFDFAAIADATRHPYRLQSEQFKLTRILLAKLEGTPGFEIAFNRRVVGLSQDADGVTVEIAREGGSVETRRGRFLIGADGARSQVRHALNVEFEGFTWPERFLVLSTPFDFYSVMPNLDAVSYVADPELWHFLLKVPDLWRVMFPVHPDMSDQDAVSAAFGQSLLKRACPQGPLTFEIAHATLYRVHQRVAKSYRVGRAFLAGDAAHINNPLGGMGMNGGIHDAVSLSQRLAKVWHKEASEAELDRYDLQRRQVTVEYVQTQTIQNKRNLEAASPEDQARFTQQMRRVKDDPAAMRDYLMRVSMFASLKRASELG
ncbi:FAD-dependent monooxygenase [Xanthobacter sp. KR7-225]|uniref:FAD-dependent oxidoreductase n=1 Tax=Xanthobacter sp. KR7-225 TaxID=3156613 RepID=UPI0032B4E755